jgi:hypothetical protein
LHIAAPEQIALGVNAACAERDVETAALPAGARGRNHLRERAPIDLGRGSGEGVAERLDDPREQEPRPARRFPGLARERKLRQLRDRGAQRLPAAA